MSEPRKTFYDRSLVQLTLVRFREFIRQPEAVFWTFVFPILLAVGLGVAFRSRPPARQHVAIVKSSDRMRIDQVASVILQQSLKADSGIIVEMMDDTAARHALRTSRVALVISPLIAEPGTVVQYMYDPAREESRTARMIADRAIQAGGGRKDPVRVADLTVT